MNICGLAGAPWEPDEWEDGGIPCCAGSATLGPSRCTCWEPVYDLVQADPDPLHPLSAREEMCEDCAYRPGSPERSSEREDDLLALPTGRMGVFFCHQGLRRPTEYQHPDGRIHPGDPADYQPPIIEGIPFKADGTPADVCAGYLALAARGERR